MWTLNYLFDQLYFVNKRSILFTARQRCVTVFLGTYLDKTCFLISFAKSITYLKLFVLTTKQYYFDAFYFNEIVMNDNWIRINIMVTLTGIWTMRACNLWLNWVFFTRRLVISRTLTVVYVFFDTGSLTTSPAKKCDVIV